MILNTETRQVPIGRLLPHPENPRRGNVTAIAESIRVNGFYGTIVAQKSTGYILAGNHRWQAAQEAGLEKVPVVYVDVDDAAARRILLADNKTADGARYDDDALARLLSDLGTLDGTGWSNDELDALLGSLTPSDVVNTPKGLGVPVISYQIVFDSEAQQETWYKFMRKLRDLHPNADTNAERLTAFLAQHADLS